MRKLSGVLLLFVFLLTGCPGSGDRLTPSETTNVTLESQNICFGVMNPQDYQPSIIIISPRNTPYTERWYREKPDLNVKEGKLCIPPSFYTFTNNTPYIVEYALTSATKGDASRHIVVGFELVNGHAKQLDLTSGEISQ